MHERLEALKTLLKAGEYEKAAVILKEYRVEFPNDWDGKLMEGIIAQLQGDEETFRRIHDEMKVVNDEQGKQAAIHKVSPQWRKYHRIWGNIVEKSIIGLIIAGAVVTATATATAMINPSVKLRIQWVGRIITHGKAEADRWYRSQSVIDVNMALYHGPEYYEKGSAN